MPRAGAVSARLKKESGLGLPPSRSCRQFGNAVGVTASVGEHPAVSGKFLPLFSEPLAVALRVSLDPTLKVVGAVSGKDFARGGVVSEMCHDFFLFFSRELSPSVVIILYHISSNLSIGFSKIIVNKL